MSLSIISRASVIKAIKEYDELGETLFLGTYGFHPAKEYFLEYRNQLYPSKAIAGVAHKYEPPDFEQLFSKDFVGGEDTVKRKLEHLEFKVRKIPKDTNLNILEDSSRSTRRKVPITGYWTFICNQAIWQIDRFLETNEEYNYWSVNKWYEENMKPGQLGVIRVGIDTRSKKILNGKPRLECGIYAVVEIISKPHKRPKTPDGFWLKQVEANKDRQVVDIKYLFNLLNTPILLKAILEDPKLQSDTILENSFENVCMPLKKEAFLRIMEIIEGDDNLPIKTYDEPIDNLNEIRDLEEKYRFATPEVKDVHSLRIERGPFAKKIKKLNKYKCQICEAIDSHSYSFFKKNGEPYIEAHHVHPVAEMSKGSLSFANIITVCANHHRQLHYGDVEILQESIDDFIFRIESNKIIISKVKL